LVQHSTVSMPVIGTNGGRHKINLLSHAKEVTSCLMHVSRKVLENGTMA